MYMQAVTLATLLVGTAVAVPQVGADKQQPLAGFILGRAIGATWEAVNDPVMGGVSESGFKVQGNKGIWEGEVKIVPRLHAPGFCRVNGDIGSHDLSESAGLVFKMAGRGDPAKTVMAQIETGHSDFKGQFVANITGVSSDMKSIFVPFSSFRPFGIRPEAGGAPTKSVLKHVMQVGFLADGTKGKFEIELEEVLAGNAGPGPTPSPAPTGGLTLFEFGSSSKPWMITNDPVMVRDSTTGCLLLYLLSVPDHADAYAVWMNYGYATGAQGGRSHSTFKVEGGLGIFAGEVAIVPALKAPGFCNAFAKIASADASACEHRISIHLAQTPD